MTQSPPEGMLPVTQDDREAAAMMIRALDGFCERATLTEEGYGDDFVETQALARYRLAAEARTRDAEDRVREAVENAAAYLVADAGVWREMSNGSMAHKPCCQASARLREEAVDKLRATLSAKAGS